VSAWAELVNADGSDEWLELCNKALAEVQREAGRRIASRIAKLAEDTSNDDVKSRSLCGEYWTALDEAEDIALTFFGVAG
jgi:hypothetical protein